MNIENILLPQPILFLNSILLTLGMICCCQNFSRFFLKKNYSNDHFPIYFILFLALISIIISYLLFFGFDYLNIALKILGSLISITGLFFILKSKNKIIKFFNETSLNNIWIKIGIISYFIIIFMPATDADSLDYHLGAPLVWYENQSFIFIKDWLMIRQYGSGEIINYFGIANGIDNLNSCLNFIFIIFLLRLTNNILKKDNQILFSLIILSIPVNLFLFPSQKPMFYFMIAWIIIFIYLFDKNLTKKKYVLFNFFNLSFITLSKLSFLIYSIPLWFFLLFNKNIKKELSTFNFIFLSAFIFIIFCFPFYFFNFQNYFNPISPIFDQTLIPLFGGKISPETINFSEYTRTYYGTVVTHWLEYIINFFITLDPGKISTVFGISFILFFSKKINNFFKNKNVLLLLIIVLLILISGQYQPRYYYAPYSLLIFYLIKTFHQKDILNIKQTLIKLQFLIVISMMLIFSSINFLSIFSQKFRHNTLSNHAFEYDENIWLNQKKIQGTIFTDLRTRIFMNNQNIFDQRLKYIDNENFIEKEINYLIKSNQIDYVFYDNDLKNESIKKILINLKKCTEKKNLETIDFNYNVSRNPFNLKSNKKEKVFFKIDKNLC